MARRDSSSCCALARSVGTAAGIAAPACPRPATVRSAASGPARLRRRGRWRPARAGRPPAPRRREPGGLGSSGASDAPQALARVADDDVGRRGARDLRLVPGAAALLVGEAVDDHGRAAEGSVLTIEPTTMAVAWRMAGRPSRSVIVVVVAAAAAVVAAVAVVDVDSVDVAVRVDVDVLVAVPVHVDVLVRVHVCRPLLRTFFPACAGSEPPRARATASEMRMVRFMSASYFPAAAAATLARTTFPAPAGGSKTNAASLNEGARFQV